MTRRTMQNRKQSERGLTLLETVIAAAVMLVGIGGVMSLFTVAAMKNASQGSQATRCTEYAQDKMEQLMALSFGDSTSDTTQIPTATTGGQGLNIGGSTATPTAGYVDYISESTGTGAALSATQQSNSWYRRSWQVSYQAGSSNNIKTIVVVVTALRSSDSTTKGALIYPSTTLVSQKANF